MIIGVLGKGGSGKSTVATNLVKALASNEQREVLAIDADHNMDLTYNLNITEPFPYLGSAMPDIKKSAGLTPTANYREALLKNDQGLFSIAPKDLFTEKYTHTIKQNLALMASGPQTDDVLTDKSCSHILFTPLKVYLPLVALSENQWIVVDEKAGADGVSTGIPTGFDVALIVAEPTVHGIKAARQIAGLLDHYEVPYEFIVNKITETHSLEEFSKEFGKEPFHSVGFDQAFSTFNTEESMNTLIEKLVTKRDLFTGKRFKRSRDKFSHWNEEK